MRLLDEYDLISIISKHIGQDRKTLDKDYRKIIDEVQTYKIVSQREKERWCCDCAYIDMDFFNRPCRKYCINNCLWIDKLSDDGRQLLKRYKENRIDL